MAEKLAQLACLALDHWQEIVVAVSIIVCVNIFLVGAVKTFLFNKIENKLLRKAACFTFSLILLAGVSALYFVIKSVSFKFYLYAYLVCVPVEIVLYAGYENWGIRDLVDFIAKKTLVKIVPVLAKNFKNGEKDKAELANALTGAEKETKERIADTVDKDLIKLLK